MERLIPLIGYNKALCNDSWGADKRENDHRVRHWALVWWEHPTQGGKMTAEICVITEGMPDFCGGMMVYSPRVDIHKCTGSWSSNFCLRSEHGIPEDELSYEWENFDPETDALDLVALTGKKDWTIEEVTSYGFRSIAGAVAAQAASYCKRGIIGADRIGGRMTTLWEVMSTMNTIAAYPSYRLNVGEIKADITSMRDKSTWADTCALQCPSIRYDKEWFNVNSGNKCHWLIANISPSLYPQEEGDGSEFECGECGHYNEYRGECEECGHIDEGCQREHTFPRGDNDNNVKVLGSVKYRLRARRHFWRNG